MTIEFNNNKERENHPQGKKINAYLMKYKFKNTLNNIELSVLKRGLRALPENNNYANLNKTNIFLCLLLSGVHEDDSLLLCEFARKKLNLEYQQIIQLLISVGKFDTAEKLKSKLNNLALVLFVANTTCLSSLASTGDSQLLSNLLNFNLFNGAIVKDYLSTDDYISILNESVKNGLLDIFKLMTKILGENTKNAIKAISPYDIDILFESGYLDIISEIAKVLGDDANKYFNKRGNKYFVLACENGHLDVVCKHIEILGKDINYLKFYNDNAYELSCKNGHIHIVKKLNEILFKSSEKHLSYYKNPRGTELYYQNNHQYFLFKGYEMAFKNKHFNIVDEINNILSEQEKKEIIKSSLFKYACDNGDSESINKLNEILGKDAKGTIKILLKKHLYNYYSNYSIFRNICENRHVEVITKLHDILGDDLKEIVRYDDYSAYRAACENGCLEIVNKLSEILGENLKKIIEYNNYSTYKVACRKGHIEIVNILSEILGKDEVKAIKVDNYSVYRSAPDSLRKYLLLQSVGCFAYAEMHDKEYGEKSVYAIASMKLNLFRKQKLLYEKEDANGVFDLDITQARHGFYLLRNFIRRGVRRSYYKGLNEYEVRRSEEFNEDIGFLINIPAIQSLCHQAVSVDEYSPGQENELLRLALKLGNHQAASVLLQLPEVFRIAAKNDFYKQEEHGTSLRKLTKNRESPVVSLSPDKTIQVDKINSHYMLKKQSIDEDFDDLKKRLKARYEAKPARITFYQEEEKGGEITLPLEWNEFQILCNKLTELQIQEALKTYYQDDLHTAYRYLSKSNYWEGNNVSFVYFYKNERGELTNLRCATYKEHKPLITQLYRAAFYENSAIDGFSQDLFIKQLALMGRSTTSNSSPYSFFSNNNYKKGADTNTKELSALFQKRDTGLVSKAGH